MINDSLIICIIIFAAVSLNVAGCSHALPPLDDLGPVDKFSLTERSGRTVTQADLAGKIWLASFVFTRCAGPCPRVTGLMAKLQKEFANQKDVFLVSVTVDPDHDTPAVLKKYAAAYQADPQRWLFLTGPRKDVYTLVQNQFHLGVQPTRGTERTPGNEVTHSTRIVLVDRRGHIRKYFDGVPPDASDPVPQIRQAVTMLLREQP